MTFEHEKAPHPGSFLSFLLLCTVLAVMKLFAEQLWIVRNAVAVIVILDCRCNSFLCKDGAVDLMCGQSRASTTALLESSSASSTFFPLMSSVAMELVAIALPQPKVLNLTSVMMPSLTLMYIS